jgi:hypothetical protein
VEAQRYTLTQEPKSDLYRGILNYALKPCSMALVVVRPDISLTVQASQVIEQLKPFMQTTDEASEWPGTQLLSGTAIVYCFAYNAKTATILQNHSARLFQWVQPDLPEDLCLLKSIDRPWLVSIAHEGDGYFILQEADL